MRNGSGDGWTSITAADLQSESEILTWQEPPTVLPGALANHPHLAPIFHEHLCLFVTTT